MLGRWSPSISPSPSDGYRRHPQSSCQRSGGGCRVAGTGAGRWVAAGTVVPAGSRKGKLPSPFRTPGHTAPAVVLSEVGGWCRVARRGAGRWVAAGTLFPAGTRQGGSAAAPRTPRGSVPDWRGIDSDWSVGFSGGTGEEAGKGNYRPPFEPPGSSCQRSWGGCRVAGPGLRAVGGDRNCPFTSFEGRPFRSEADRGRGLL